MSYATAREVSHTIYLGPGPFRGHNRTVSVTTLQRVLGWVSDQMTAQNHYAARLRVRTAARALDLSRLTIMAALDILEGLNIIAAVDRQADLADGAVILYRWEVPAR